VNLGTAQVIRANSRNLPLADNSVDLVVTSPPYFALRSYQDGGEH
jgi:site-specific DNA-methyltransferase (cytosine-N4-specific)